MHASHCLETDDVTCFYEDYAIHPVYRRMADSAEETQTANAIP